MSQPQSACTSVVELDFRSSPGSAANGVDAGRREPRKPATNIFVLIAGSYTPFVARHGTLAAVILITVWSAAFAGAVFKLIWIDAPGWLVAATYISIGLTPRGCRSRSSQADPGVLQGLVQPVGLPRALLDGNGVVSRPAIGRSDTERRWPAR
jgi:hypothetical protein